MALNWKSVTPEHVRQAITQVRASRAGSRTSGLVIWFEDQALPAKEVLSVAYRFANNLPPQTQLRFASGDATLRLLSQLGFKSERLSTRSVASRAAPRQDS